ncbi:MAG TPA: ABC transporter substrate-binding protein [Thermomicrobiales bacterium]|nr:ABC transporter substrate-binding protein [Thermomicrobiales bacterium]
MSYSQKTNRRTLLKLGAAGTAVVVAGRYGVGSTLAQVPTLEKKDTYTVGFAQTDSANPWRLAETASMKKQFEEDLGWTLIATDANADTAKQLADLDSIIAQQPDIIIFPPRESKALAPKVLEIKDAGIPVILIDRDVDHEIAKPGEDYITFIGSDFVDQGRRAAEWLAKATGGNAKIIELEGTTGADPAIDRKKGFDDYIAGTFKGSPTAEGALSGMEIIASQSGNFTRDEGRQVMETLLQAHPEVTAVYAHNDEMAIGAIAALEAAGRKPGEDVILVSIDGENAAMDAIAEGKLGASVESSPFFGPIAYETMMKFIDGEDIPDWVKVEDRFFDESNAKDFQGKQF